MDLTSLYTNIPYPSCLPLIPTRKCTTLGKPPKAHCQTYPFARSSSSDLQTVSPFTLNYLSQLVFNSDSSFPRPEELHVVRKLVPSTNRSWFNKNISSYLTYLSSFFHHFQPSSNKMFIQVILKLSTLVWCWFWHLFHKNHYYTHLILTGDCSEQCLLLLHNQ